MDHVESHCGFSSSLAVPRADFDRDGADRLIRSRVLMESGERRARFDLLPDGQVWKVVLAEGTASQQTASTTTYSDNGLPLGVANARGYVTGYAYDGFDRLLRLAYPDATSGTPSTTDSISYAYDKRDLLLRRSLRGSATVAPTCVDCLKYGYDELGRLRSKTAPTVGGVASYGVAYEYDLLDRPLSIGFVGSSPAELRWTWDKASRPLTAIAYGRGITYAYAPPAAGLARTMTWPSGGGSLLGCTDAVGRVTRLKEAPDCTNDTGRLVTYGYDDLSRRISEARANGTSSTWTYAQTGALGSLSHNLAGSTDDATFTYGYNRAQQIASVTRNNDAYAWTNHYNVKRPYTTNALDQYTRVSAARPTYDARGNLASDNIGGRPWTYAYDAEDRLVQASLRGTPALTLSYDPAGRLRRSEGDGTTEFLYDGDQLIGEYVGGSLARRYVPGPAPDETAVAYEGADKFWYYGDHLGSVIATAGASGTVAAINAYGPFGEPGVPAANRNLGRLRYTGQIFLPEVGLYHFKARAYSPRWGRFLQTDPIGAAGGANLYAYAGNDPINFVDPSGLAAEWAGSAAWDLTQRSTAPYVDFYERSIAGPINWGLREISETPAGDPGLWQSIQGAGPLGAAAGTTIGAVARGLRAYGNAIGRVASGATPIARAAKGPVGPIAGGGAKLENLAPGDIVRIQNAADRTGTPITVVGSRANGTARANSDWDYVLPEGTRGSTRHSLSSSLPEGPRGLGEPRNQDFFLDPLNPSKPHIIFTPKPRTP